MAVAPVSPLLRSTVFARRATLALCGALLACGERSEPTIFGDWIISDHLAPDQSPMTPAEARRWYGTSITLDSARASLAAKTCIAPAYNRWTASRERFEAQYRISAGRLGITSDSVRIVQIDCRDGRRANATEAFVLDHDKLIFSMDGVYFLLTRPPAASSAPTKTR